MSSSSSSYRAELLKTVKQTPWMLALDRHDMGVWPWGAELRNAVTGELIHGVTTIMDRLLMVRRPKPPSKVETQQTVAGYSAYIQTGVAKGASIGGPTGRQRGSLVHEQMKHLISLGGQQFVEEYRTGIHVWTVELMQGILDRTWQPFKPEWVIGDLAANIGGKVDLVALTLEGKLLFLEYKTGYRGHYYKPDRVKKWRDRLAPRLESVLKGTTCTPYDQAVIQLTLYTIAARRVLGLPAGSYEAWTIRVADDTFRPEFRQVPQTFIDETGEQLYEQVAYALARHARLKKRRRSSKGGGGSSKRRKV